MTAAGVWQRSLLMTTECCSPAPFRFAGARITHPLRLSSAFTTCVIGYRSHVVFVHAEQFVKSHKTLPAILVCWPAYLENAISIVLRSFQHERKVANVKRLLLIELSDVANTIRDEIVGTCDKTLYVVSR